MIDKRSTHIPLQHLTGEQEFMGLTFKVNEHVLIPRQDTEVLVEEALNYVRSGMDILDVCTGSGCILLSGLKLGEKKCRGILHGPVWDLSREALQVAEENAGRLQVEATFLHSDLFAEVQGQYDMILSNPPYMRKQWWRHWKKRCVSMSHVWHWMAEKTVLIFTGRSRQRVCSI